jgi:diaminohydroxyphosphoribosylaminopyrimidine deaminase/5-amino-6-(5-phosphoribosylamino)uracil reductase
MRDPFPQVDGAGFDKLRAAGIAVEWGLMEAQARQLNRGFLSRVERGRPWVRIKLGTSLDGRTAMASGESKWITGEASRLDVQKWRARAGALITGANTVLIDDPSLNVRLGDDTPFVAPLRVVLDPGLATIARGKVRDDSAPTLYLHASDAKPPHDLHVERDVVPVLHGRFDLEAVLKLLAVRGVNEVQVEAGATLAGAFIAAGLADEVLLYVAPVLLGERARPLFAGLGIDAMAQRAQLKVVDARAIGEDQRLLLVPIKA